VARAAPGHVLEPFRLNQASIANKSALLCRTSAIASRTSREERENKKENNDLDIVFSVDNVDALYEEYSQKPIEIIQPLCERPYGKEFYIADPDGYILAFLEE